MSSAFSTKKNLKSNQLWACTVIEFKQPTVFMFSKGSWVENLIIRTSTLKSRNSPSHFGHQFVSWVYTSCILLCHWSCRKTGLLVIDAPPYDTLTKMQDVLESINHKYTKLTGPEISRAYPGVKVSADTKGIIEHDGWILMADKCLRLMQVRRMSSNLPPPWQSVWF